MRHVRRWYRRALRAVLDALERRRSAPERYRTTFGWLWWAVDSMLDPNSGGRLKIAVDISPFWEPLTGVG